VAVARGVPRAGATYIQNVWLASLWCVVIAVVLMVLASAFAREPVVWIGRDITVLAGVVVTWWAAWAVLGFALRYRAAGRWQQLFSRLDESIEGEGKRGVVLTHGWGGQFLSPEGLACVGKNPAAYALGTVAPADSSGETRFVYTPMALGRAVKTFGRWRTWRFRIYWLCCAGAFGYCIWRAVPVGLAFIAAPFVLYVMRESLSLWRPPWCLTRMDPSGVTHTDLVQKETLFPWADTVLVIGAFNAWILTGTLIRRDGVVRHCLLSGDNAAEIFDRIAEARRDAGGCGGEVEKCDSANLGEPGLPDECWRP
jgi:hypothetical protein